MPVLLVKSNFSEDVVPPPVPDPELFGPGMQSTVPVVSTKLWSKPTVAVPLVNVPDALLVAPEQLTLETVMPLPAMALAKTVPSLDAVKTGDAWARPAAQISAAVASSWNFMGYSK